MPESLQDTAMALREALADAGYSAAVLDGRPPADDAVDFALTLNAPRVRPRAGAVLALRTFSDGLPIVASPFVHAVLTTQAPLPALVERAKAILRSVRARDEAGARVRAASRAGLTYPRPHLPGRGRVVYLGPPAPACLALESALCARGLDVVMCVTPMQALDALHREGAACLVLHADHAPARAMTVLSAVQRSRALALTPAFVLNARNVRAETDSYLLKGASAVATLPLENDARLADWIADAVARRTDAKLIDALLRRLDAHADSECRQSFAYRALMAQRMLAPPVAAQTPVWALSLQMDAAAKAAPARIANALRIIVRSSDAVWACGRDQVTVLVSTQSDAHARTVRDRITAFGAQALGLSWRRVSLHAGADWAKSWLGRTTSASAFA